MYGILHTDIEIVLKHIKIQMDPFFCTFRKSVAGFYGITDQIGKYRTQIIIIDLNICRDLTNTGKCNLRFFRKTVL